MNPAFSILIINYNGAKHLGPCLAALEDQTLPRYQYEVIVLDNASPDGSASIVENEYPHVRLIRSQTNLGFAEGNNVAKSYARGEWLILLNNDTIPDPHWLAEMQREVISNTANGVERIVSKLVLGPDGKSINSGGVVLLRSGWAADEGFRQVDDGRFEQPREVFAGCGAALMIRNRPGPIFPRDYFAYYEDVDAAWNDRAHGHGTRYAPRAVVMHALGSAAGEHSPFFTYLTERNRLLTTVKRADPFLAVVATAKFACKALFGIVRSRTPHTKSRLRALGSFLLRLPATLTERYDARSASVSSSALTLSSAKRGPR